MYDTKVKVGDIGMYAGAGRYANDTVCLCKVVAFVKERNFHPWVKVINFYPDEPFTRLICADSLTILDPALLNMRTVKKMVGKMAKEV